MDEDTQNTSIKQLSIDHRAISTYIILILITLGALFVIKEFDIYYPLNVTTSARSTELSVVGEGKVEIVPDTASINAGITVENADSAEAAQNQLSEINNAIIQAMKGLGIDEQNIQTSNYSVNPRYSYDESRSIDGFTGNATITIKTQNTELISQIITSATTAGANQIQGVQFSVDDPSSYREQARQEAIDNAREQARKLANELGIKLGNVTNIVESQPGNIIPYQTRTLSLPEVGGGGASDIEPGSQTITSTVTLFFEKR